MDLGKVIFSLMGVLLIGFCLVASVQFLIPLNQKVEMDQVCRDYMYRVNVSQGLATAEKNALTLNLEQIGLDKIRVTCPGEGELARREQGLFKVSGVIKTRVPEGFLNFAEKELPYEFVGSVFGKVIIN